MASITGLGKIGLPRLSENMDPDDARALRNYLYQMQDRKSTRLNSSHEIPSRMPSSA